MRGSQEKDSFLFWGGRNVSPSRIICKLSAAGLPISNEFTETTQKNYRPPVGTEENNVRPNREGPSAKNGAAPEITCNVEQPSKKQNAGNSTPALKGKKSRKGDNIVQEKKTERLVYQSYEARTSSEQEIHDEFAPLLVTKVKALHTCGHLLERIREMRKGVLATKYETMGRKARNEGKKETQRMMKSSSTEDGGTQARK